MMSNDIMEMIIQANENILGARISHSWERFPKMVISESIEKQMCFSNGRSEMDSENDTEIKEVKHMEGNKPIVKFQNKGISVAIWQGDKGKTLSIQKQYMDKKTNTWKETKSYFPNEAEELLKLLTEGIAELKK